MQLLPQILYRGIFMPIQKDLADLIQRVQATSRRHNYTPQKYEKLTDKYGFRSGGEWIKETNKKVFLDTIFNLKTFEEIRQVLKRFGKIRFDLDGLKSVNDIGNHRLGDILLDLVAQAMVNQRIYHFRQSFSLKIEIDRAGGDEFDFFIERAYGSLDEEVCYEIFPGKILTRPIIFLLRDLIILEVSLSPFPQMDFHSPDIQERLGEYGCSLLKKTEQSSGEKFFFTPSVSAGECILWDVLLRFLEEKPERDVSLGKLGDILMGMVEDISGELVTKRKNVLRKTLWDSPSPKRNMQALLITRSQADKEIAILIHKLRYLNKQRSSLFGEIYSLQSLKECALAEMSHKTNPRSKKFLKEVEECISFVRDNLFSLDEKIRELIQ